MANRAPFTIHREVCGFDLVFRWWGGEYVDISWPGGEAFEVINVWDAGTGEPRIERTLTALRERVEEWVNDPEASRCHDLAEYAIGRQR